jgi:hypothetical protein
MSQLLDSAHSTARARHIASDWAHLSSEIRRRYHRLIAYHVRRVRHWYPDLTEEDLAQEIELAIGSALRAWNRRRAVRMQYSTYLHWHLAKRLSRLAQPGAETVPLDDDRTEQF